MKIEKTSVLETAGSVWNDKRGFVKLSRSFLNWRWYKHGNTKDVFLHLFLCANFKPCDFETITVQRGQVVTSYASLAQALGLTVRNVRTAVSHLKKTGEVQVQGFHNFSLVTVVNYEKYQSICPAERQDDDMQVTGKRQQEKKEKNENNLLSGELTPPTPEEVTAFVAENELPIFADKFYDYYSKRGWIFKNGKPIGDWQALARHWAKTQMPLVTKNQSDQASYDMALFEKMLNED